MTKQKNTKRALLASVLSMMLCMAMLVGSTFAWFTDSVTSGKNRIVAGNLDVELEYAKEFYDDGSVKTWESVQDVENIFNPDALWEPGHAEVAYLRLRNAGTLALKYNFIMNVASEKTSYNADNETIRLSHYLQYGMVAEQTEKFENRAAAINAVQNPLSFNPDNTYMSSNTTIYSDEGNLLNQGEESYVALVVFMPTTVGNEANWRQRYSSTTAPSIELDFQLLATQVPHEEDSFGPDYDKDAWDGKMVDTTWYNETESEFEIDSLAALAGLASITQNADTADQTFTLTSDFDLEGKSLQIQNFEGVFDGNGHEIKGVNSTLFTSPKGTADDYTEIKNLTVTGNTTSSALVANSPKYVYIDNVITNGSITASKAGGAMVGQVSLYSSTPGEVLKITNSTNNASITVNDSKYSSYQAGGIIGYSALYSGDGTVVIENCTNNGAIIFNDDVTIESSKAGRQFGGIVGLGGNVIINSCYNTGAVSGVDSIGGIVGSTAGSKSAVTNCYNTGSVTATDNTQTNIGGIVGLDAYGALIVDSCYNSGKISGGAKNSGIVGGTAGTGDHYTKCYYLAGSAEQGYGALNKPDTEGKYISKTDEEMKLAATFDGWDTGVWSLKDGSYPTLIME